MAVGFSRGRAGTAGTALPGPAACGAVRGSALAGALEGSVPALAPLLATTSSFLGALAAGSAPQWIDDDADPLADRVTRRDSALLATADELTDSASRAAAGLLD